MNELLDRTAQDTSPGKEQKPYHNSIKHTEERTKQYLCQPEMFSHPHSKPQLQNQITFHALEHPTSIETCQPAGSITGDILKRIADKLSFIV